MKSYVNIAGLLTIVIALYHVGIVCHVPVTSNGSIDAIRFLTPWFIFKSGICFKSGVNKKKLFQNLLLPYIVFSVVGYVLVSFYSLIVDNEYDWRHYIVTPIWKLVWEGATDDNLPLWFLLTLFFCHMLYDTIFSFLGYSDRKNLLFIIACILIAWGCNVFKIYRPLYFANTFMCLAFFATGYYVRTKQYDNRFLLLSILVLIISICTTVPSVNIRTNILYEGFYPLFFPYVFACCIIINNAFYRLPLCNKLFLTIGMDSYFIYVSHWIIITIVHRIIGRLFPDYNLTQLVISVILFSTVIMIVLCQINRKYNFMKLVTKKFKF